MTAQMRRHYLRLATERIDEEIMQLTERKADIQVEIVRIDQAVVDDYPVTCDCGYFGFRLECSYGRCPNCGDRVRRENFNGRE